MQRGSNERLLGRTVALVVLVLLFSASTGFQFYLHAGERRCFTESVSPNTKVLGEYTVSTGKGHMPVDIRVTVPEAGNQVLYEKSNIGHGKFAFVVPFPESREHWKVKHAELRRKEFRHRLHHHLNNQWHKAEHGTQGRKLLSVDREEHGRGAYDRHHVRGRQYDEHGRAKPPESLHEHEHNHHTDVHDTHRHKHHNHHEEHGNHGAHHVEDEYDEDDEYDYDDDLDDFDEEDYDGIEDDDLDNEIAEHEAEHIKAKGGLESASDSSKEEQMFDLQRFEVCVFHNGAKEDHLRRVRLVVHKGETAHDYTRLARKEHMTQLEVSLRRVSEELHELLHELDKARQREDLLRKLNENTGRRVVILAVLSLGSLIAVGGYQFSYTKRFFKRKKIL